MYFCESLSISQRETERHYANQITSCSRGSELIERTTMTMRPENTRENFQFPFANGIEPPSPPLFANRNESIRGVESSSASVESGEKKKKNAEEQDEGIDLCVSPVIACFILIRVHTVAAAVTSSNVSRLIKATLLLARSISPPSPPSAIFFFISFPLELFICPPRALIFAVCPPLFLSIGESQRKRKNWRKENKEIN